MKRFAFAWLLPALASAVTLNGCGDRVTQASVFPAGATSRPMSWMSPDAGAKNLLYVSSYQQVLVYDYGTNNEVGKLDYFTDAAGSCTDAKGDVFVTNYGAADILEFAHGKSSPIRTLIDPSPYAYDCAVDPSTGNLAVVNEYGQSQYSPGNVALYTDAKGNPKTYKINGFSTYASCTYDSEGDLLVGDIESSDVGKFAMLPHGSSKFAAVSLPADQNWISYGFTRWDGAYFDVEYRSAVAPSFFVWYTIKGSKGTQEGYTTMEESGDIGGPFWLGRIAKNRSVKRANQLVVAIYNFGITGWDYPRGGDYIFLLYGVRGDGVTVSLAR